MEGEGEQPVASLSLNPPWFLGIVKGLSKALELERTPEIMSADSFTFQMEEPMAREGQVI